MNIEMIDDFSTTERKIYPVVIIGAGPVGLAAAAHLSEKGAAFLVLEAGNSVAASMLSWGHVKLFSPWQYCFDEAARRILERYAWVAPDLADFPTGQDLAERFFLPLAATPELNTYIRTNSRVVSISRFGMDKMKNEGRAEAPFIVVTESPDGTQEVVFARAVIDASGTYTSPNPLGSSGIAAPGESLQRDSILYRIPDTRDQDHKRFVSKRVAVVGSGHSAFNSLIELTDLAKDEPGTEVVWVVRKTDLSSTYGGESGDALPERGALGSHIRALVESKAIGLESGFRIASVERNELGVILVSEDSREILVDEIVANTGFRPNLTMLSELRLALHPAVESPVALAEMIDPNFHSCGTVDPHGAVELAHPEKDFYIAGMKSYGRAPTFLMMTGYEQVRSIACELTGDFEGARKVELVLPETGVCSGDGCCTPPPHRKTLAATGRPLTSLQVVQVGAGCDPNSACC